MNLHDHSGQKNKGSNKKKLMDIKNICSLRDNQLQGSVDNQSQTRGDRQILEYFLPETPELGDFEFKPDYDSNLNHLK